jgi:putative isomerase
MNRQDTQKDSAPQEVPMTLHSSNIPLSRAWNTWSAFPAELVFLPMGVRLSPVVYSDRLRQASRFPAGNKIRFGRHAVDGHHIDIELTHGGTTLNLDYEKHGSFDVVGCWRTKRLGEWGLRVWLNLCFSCEIVDQVSYDLQARAALVQVGSRFVALVSSAEPVAVSGHPTIDALLAEYETRGYFYRGSRSLRAPVIALRFNLEMMREARFAMAVADRADLAVGRARDVLDSDTRAKSVAKQSGRFHGALEAVEDLIGWNTVYDEVNRRPYTSISRNWNLNKFGGFGVWLNDQQYAAYMSALFDAELGRQNLSVALANETPQGNFACLITAEDAWVDRNQLPLGAFLVWLMYIRSGSRALLDQSFEALARNHAWWWRWRDPHRKGLASFGTSAVGDGLYAGTAFAARNESSMDNAPIHDEADYDPLTRTLTCADVGLNSLLALDAEMLAAMAAELGQTRRAADLRSSASALKKRIAEHLWDASRGLFANRLRSGKFVNSVGPTSFYPLLCGAASAEQAQRLLTHLADPATFGGAFVIPSVSRDDPAFADNMYWRGRIWPPLNFLVWHGLRRYGFDEQAGDLAQKSVDVFRANWQRERLCPENFNSVTGVALDQPDTEGFYSWGALMPLLGVAEIMDITPWRGWEICNDGRAGELGPIESPIGSIIIAVKSGELEIRKGDAVLLRSNIIGRLSHIRWRDGRIDLELPSALAEGAFLQFPSVAAERVEGTRFAGETVNPQVGTGGELIIANLPNLPRRQILSLFFQ